MLFVDPELSSSIIESLVLAKLSGIGRAVEVVNDIAERDQLSAFIAFLLVGYQSGSYVGIASPWIEDIAIRLPSSIARYLGVEEIVKLSDMVNGIARRGRAILITRSSRSDLYVDTSIGRRELLSALEPLPSIEVVYSESIHMKCVEVDNYALISTANLTEKELYKLRTYDNTISMSSRPCIEDHFSSLHRAVL